MRIWMLAGAALVPLGGIEWMTSWEKASKKAETERKLIVVAMDDPLAGC